MCHTSLATTLLLVIFASLSCSFIEPVNAQPTIAAYLQSNPALSQFVNVLSGAGLLARLDDNNRLYTVFAPINSALTKFSTDVAIGNVNLGVPLRDVLLFHISEDGLQININTFNSNDFVFVRSSLKPSPSVSNNTYYIRFNIYQDGKLYVNGRRFQNLPLNTSWPTVILGPQTTNIIASNGIVHLIDGVLIPQSIPQINEDRTIIQTLQDDPRFTTLVSLLGGVDLSSVSTCAFTLFAPTNEAFEKIPPGVIEIITSNIQTLEDIILYHIVNSTYFSVGLTNQTLRSAQGSNLAIFRPTTDLFSASLLVNNILANPTNIHRFDGVIHVIDTLLIPEICIPPKADGCKRLADYRFWCNQFTKAYYASRFNYWYYRNSAYNAEELQRYVDFIAANSPYFANIKTLNDARGIICGSNSLVRDAYTLWLDLASANLYAELYLQDFCGNDWNNYWRKSSYNYHCRKFTVYTRPNTSNSGNNLQTVSDLVDWVETALASNSRSLKISVSNYLYAFFQKQAPGTFGCPGTCGASGAAARAISNIENSATFASDETNANNGLSTGVVAVISAVVTAFFVIGLTILMTYIFREKVVQLLTPAPK